jgi:hypothetical protein
MWTPSPNAVTMPGLDCRCGYRIRYSEIPCPDEWVFMSEKDYEGYQGMVDAEALYCAFKSFLRCPSCGRLWVFWNGFQDEAEEYLPASSK